jgi:hypothetical protein
MARGVNRRRQLRDRFGPEYDRAVQASGSSKQAAADLRARTEERDRLSIRSLNEAQRNRYELDWRQVQTEFVDAPPRALGRADALVTDVMVDLGYPRGSSIGRPISFRSITPRLSSTTAAPMEFSTRAKWASVDRRAPARVRFVQNAFRRAARQGVRFNRP